MSKNYSQLSQEQRYQIEALLHIGTPQNEIALQLGESAYTISRELSRNVPERGRGALVYSASIAQRKTSIRHRLKPKSIRFCREQREIIREWLSQPKLSPELIAIAGRISGIRHCIGILYMENDGGNEG